MNPLKVTVFLLLLSLGCPAGLARAGERDAPVEGGCLGVEWEPPGGRGFNTSMDVDLGTFVLRFEDDVTPEDAAYIQELTEAVLPHMIEALGEPSTLDTLTVGIHDSGGVYYCGWRRIRVAPISDALGFDNDEDGLVDEDPYDGIDNDGDGAVDEDLAYAPGWDEIYIHELGHAFWDDILCDRNDPSWFTEGAAQAAAYLAGARMDAVEHRRFRHDVFAREMAADEVRDLLGPMILGGPKRLIDRVVYWRYAYASAQATLLIPSLAEMTAGRDRPMVRLTDALRQELSYDGRAAIPLLDTVWITPVDGVLPPSRWVQSRSVVNPSFGDGVFLGIMTPDNPVNPVRLGLTYFKRTNWAEAPQTFLTYPLFTGVHGERTRASQLTWVPDLSPGGYRVDQVEPRDDGSKVKGTSWILELHPSVLADGLWKGVAAVFVDAEGNPVDPVDLEVDGTMVERVPGGCIAEPFAGAGSLTFRSGKRVLATVTCFEDLPRFAVVPVEAVPPRGVITWEPYHPRPGETVTATLRRNESALTFDPETRTPELKSNSGSTPADDFQMLPGNLVRARFTVPQDMVTGAFLFQGRDELQFSPLSGVNAAVDDVPHLISAGVQNGRLDLVFETRPAATSITIELAEDPQGMWTAASENPSAGAGEVLTWSVPVEAAGQWLRVRWVKGADDLILATLTLGSPPAPSRIISYAPFPNPSDLGVLWRVDLVDGMEAEFRVFDVSGRVVHGPDHLSLYAGRNQFWWDGRVRGIRAPSGIYFMRVTGKGVNLETRLVLLPR